MGEQDREVRDAKLNHVYRNRFPVRSRLRNAAPDVLPLRSAVRDLGQNARVRRRPPRPSRTARRRGNVCRLRMPQGVPALASQRRLRVCRRFALSERRSAAPLTGAPACTARRAARRAITPLFAEDPAFFSCVRNVRGIAEQQRCAASCLTWKSVPEGSRLLSGIRSNTIAARTSSRLVDTAHGGILCPQRSVFRSRPKKRTSPYRARGRKGLGRSSRNAPAAPGPVARRYACRGSGARTGGRRKSPSRRRRGREC